jgi:tRNA-uridine 2-sulfurtransferase
MSLSLKSKVLVAMSGGVDSCVTAALLAQQGFDVVGITMRVVADEHEQRPSLFQPCCSIEMAKDARQVAEKFGFPHYTLNYVPQFEQHVIQDFQDEYLSGRTPNPCVRCNQRLKFGSLHKKALEFGAEFMATGHYVRLARINGRIAVQRAVYHPKDQSYVMAGLSQRQLGMSLFPLGDLTKDQTRAIARELGLKAAETPESQDICFIPDNDYAGFLTRRVGRMQPGPIVRTSGDVLGRHKGLFHYTVGQRKGLGIAAERPLYVIRIDVENNALVVGFEEDTLCDTFSSGQVVWGGLAPQTEAFEARAQIRYHHTPVPCTVFPSAHSFVIRFHEPQKAVTPGQWSVFYDDEDRVLAAGIIDTYTTLAETHTATTRAAEA